MKVQDFVLNFKPQMTEYCPVIITSDGDIIESEQGHLQKLIELSKDPDILSKIPKNESPLLYLTETMRCVIVDYENQIYMNELTEEQAFALSVLIEKGLIQNHEVKMTHKSVSL